MNKNVIDLMHKRFTAKKFDQYKKISDVDFQTILEVGRLSPSSFGLEPWHFVVVQNPIFRARIKEYAWGAQDQSITASHFVLIFARKGKEMYHDSDYVKDIFIRVRGMDLKAYQQRIEALEKFQKYDFEMDKSEVDSFQAWSYRQTYIALGNMMTLAAQMGIDSCAVEGFNREKMRQFIKEENLINLEQFELAVMVAFGYRAMSVTTKKRRSLAEVVSYF